MGILTAKIEYGSINYGLNVEDSDHDYKLLYTPTFDDLYSSKVLDGVALPPQFNDKEHYSTMDVRHYADLLRKCNPNTIEFLFSTNKEYFLKDWQANETAFKFAFEQGYIINGWEYFTSAVRGLILNSFKRMGTNPKTCSRAFYFYSLVENIWNNNFVVNEEVLRDEKVTRWARAMRVNNSTAFNEETFKEVYDTLVNDKIHIPNPRVNDDIFTLNTKAFVEKHMMEV